MRLPAQLDARTRHGPRAENRKFALSHLLAFIAMALLAERKSLAEIQRYSQFLTPAKRRWLDWPLKKGTRVSAAPSYSALYNLLENPIP